MMESAYDASMGSRVCFQTPISNNSMCTCVVCAHIGVSLVPMHLSPPDWFSSCVVVKLN